MRTLCTIPALSSTRKCFVIACRVSFEPDVNCDIDCDRPLQSFATSCNLVLSPNAAKTGACARHTSASVLALGDIALYVLHLLCPATFVFAERFQTSMGRNSVETGLGDYQQCAVRYLLKFEFDNRGRLF